MSWLRHPSEKTHEWLRRMSVSARRRAETDKITTYERRKKMKNETGNKSKRFADKFVMLKNESFMWLLLLPTVFSLLLCRWNPIFRGMITSLFHTKGFKLVNFVGLQNFRNVLNDTMFIQTLFNTFSYVFWSLLIGILPPLVLAIALNEAVHFKQGFKVLTYLPAIAPGLAASMIWLNIYSPAPGGLLNVALNAIGLPASQWLLNKSITIPLIVVSMTWKGYGVTMLLYLSALQSVSHELYEAAVIDGAGIWKRIFKITIPHLSPTMLLLIVQQMIAVFQVFDQPLVMTDGGPNNASLTLGLTSYKMAFTYMQVDRSMALGTISFFILLIATLFYFRMQKKLED